MKMTVILLLEREMRDSRGVLWYWWYLMASCAGKGMGKRWKKLETD